MTTLNERGGCPYAHTNWTCAECGAGPGEPCRPGALASASTPEAAAPGPEVEAAERLIEGCVADAGARRALFAALSSSVAAAREEGRAAGIEEAAKRAGRWYSHMEREPLGVVAAIRSLAAGWAAESHRLGLSPSSGDPDVEARDLERIDTLDRCAREAQSALSSSVAAAREEGRREGIEEARSAVETTEPAFAYGIPDAHDTLIRAAEAVRALAEKTETKP